MCKKVEEAIRRRDELSKQLKEKKMNNSNITNNVAVKDLNNVVNNYDIIAPTKKLKKTVQFYMEVDTINKLKEKAKLKNYKMSQLLQLILDHELDKIN